MADVHILGIAGGRLTALCHFAIPNTTNAAGMNWRAVALRNGYGTTELPDGDGTLATISAAEKANIASGALVEVRQTLKLSPSPTGAEVDAAYATAKQAFLSDFQARFNRFGQVR